MTTMLRDWVAALGRLYDPSWAASWDRVGLVAGHLDQPVTHAHLAVDPTHEVVDEAVAAGAQLLIVHHPLLLQGVHAVDEGTAKGALLGRLVREKIALFTAHTNADVAAPGVSDTLGTVLGLRDLVPLEASAPDPAYKLVAYVPAEARELVVDALAAVGAGGLGAYTRCYWSVAGTGSFVPMAGAHPTVGEVGVASTVAEHRVEMLLPAGRTADVVRALRAAHPYEEPAFDIVPVVVPHGRGLGRVGDLPATTSAGDFLATTAATLPRTAAGVRLAGDPARPVRRVAVCGGAGDDLVDAALAAGADLLVTADLRHHVTLEALERGLLMIDAGHWASEWPWLGDCADRVMRALAERGHTVGTTVSSLVTDPWTRTDRPESRCGEDAGRSRDRDLPHNGSERD